MTTIYRLKISLVQPYYPITKLHRVLEISGNASFFDLHQRIFEAFDRWDEHAFQFFISRTRMDRFGSLFEKCQQIVMIDEFMEQQEDFLGHETQLYPAGQTTLDELNLQEKDYFYYWFDFGDDWLHRIRIEKIFKEEEPEQGSYFATIIKSVGESPEQYPEYDDISLQFNHKFKLVSALIPIKYKDVTWQDIIDVRIDKELLSLGFIEPYTHADDQVKITPAGEDVLAFFQKFLQENGLDLNEILPNH